MTLNNNSKHQAIIDKRRLMVSQFRLRGATQREIEEQLANQGFVNPKTGKPWALGTVNSDLRILSEQWQAEALAEMTELKGGQLAEIRAARRQAWKDGDIGQVRQLLKLEMDLLGTEAPKRQELTGADGGSIKQEVDVTDHREQLLASVAEKSKQYVTEPISGNGDKSVA